MRTGIAAAQATDHPRFALGSDQTELAAGGAIGSRAGRLGPGVLLGRYRLEAVLGEGGMGVVYAALDPELDRRVAVKVIRPELAGQSDVIAARLAREARAMAQVAHPNVITVYDVGDTAGCIFLAMELADGGTLREWLSSETRSWRAILEMFRSAGEGLAAAHSAKLVHRDFKPDNVLLDGSGRVRVTDFGLVRALEEAGSDAGGDLVERSDQPGAARSLALTRTGTTMGTPAYMAPEQHAQLPIDERCDQFSFCVALWEAIYRELPFAGRTVPELAQEVLAGDLRPAPRRPRVPSWLRRALERGLCRQPAERFPSMAALLAAIRPRRSPVAVAIAAAAAATLIGGTLALASLFGAGEADGVAVACEGGDGELEAVWGPTRKRELRAKLVAAGTPQAEAGWQLVDQALDRYGSAWLSMHRDSCQARARGEQSAEVLDLRTHCLETRLADLQQAIGLLDTTDPAVAANAMKSVDALPPVERCSTVEVLEARTPMPADPAERTRVEELRRELARADGLRRAGRYAESRALLDPLRQRAETLRYRPVIADVLYQLGRLEVDTATAAQGEATLRQAALIAESSRYDQLAAQAWIQLVAIASAGTGDLTRAAEYGEHARAALDRLGGHTRLEFEYERYMAWLDSRRSRPDQALVRYNAARRLAEKLGDPALQLVVTHGMADAYRLQGKLEEALRLGLEGLAQHAALFGVDHPETAIRRNNLAITFGYMGRHQEALEQLEKVIATRERVYGPDHLRTAAAHLHIAIVLGHLGRFQEALDHHRRARVVLERELGPEHVEMAKSNEGMGLTYVGLGRRNEAVRHLRRALAINQKRVGEEALDTVGSHINLAQTLRELGQHQEALQHDERALVTATKATGDDSLYAAHALLGVGLDLLGLKRRREARRPLERALAVFEKIAADPAATAAAQFGLAQALWLDRSERPTARQLAEKAAAALADIPPGLNTRLRAEVQSWLHMHPR